MVIYHLPYSNTIKSKIQWIFVQGFGSDCVFVEGGLYPKLVYAYNFRVNNVSVDTRCIYPYNCLSDVWLSVALSISVVKTTTVETRRFHDKL